jgi:DNA-binding MarR family transcriptional regulator
MTPARDVTAKGSVMSADGKARGHDALTPGDYEALANFRYAVRRYLAFAQEGAKSVGLTSLQHQALLAIKAHNQARPAKPMSIGDLADQLLVRHHSAVELVQRLEKAGLTRRSIDPRDRRRVEISLTTGGKAVMAVLSANNLRELQVIAPAFSGLLGQLERLQAE